MIITTSESGRTLHDDEIGIIDIELYGLKNILDGCLGRAMTTDEILARSIECDL